MSNKISQKIDMLRLITAGSVDDGKSTLIGRLLFDSKSIFEDQLEDIENVSRNSGEDELNLALLTDGLKAEREQKITIDVAYRYFATPKRKFIIADTPGHIQYTRNMVTGASTAELAIILIDATRGVLTQSKRHSFIATLLQIPHLVVAVNKMDLVDYDMQVFNNIVSDFREFGAKMDVDDITFIPISALKGDNIVLKSKNMPWYNGSTLLYHLENVHVDAVSNLIDFRMPVQYVIRPKHNFRGYAGRISSGIIRKGDAVKILPSGLKSRIKQISKPDKVVNEAVAGDSVTVQVEDDIDISRGDMICRVNNIPYISNCFDAYICWMSAEQLITGKQYILMHTTRSIKAIVRKLKFQIDVDTMQRKNADTLQVNEIGRVIVETANPLFIDNYRRNINTGIFILVDPDSNATIAAGMVRKAVQADVSEAESKIAEIAAGNIIPHDNEIEDVPCTTLVDNITWSSSLVNRKIREQRYGHKSIVIWLTGVSGAGKSTIAKSLEKKLWDDGKNVVLVDGDNLRHGLNAGLGFSPLHRKENIRRAAHLAKAFLDNGMIVICAFVSPYIDDREMAKKIIGKESFLEVYIHCEPELAHKRDPKGLYDKAKKGIIKGLTGYDAPYQKPVKPSITIDTGKKPVDENLALLYEHVVSELMTTSSDEGESN